MPILIESDSLIIAVPNANNFNYTISLKEINELDRIFKMNKYTIYSQIYKSLDSETEKSLAESDLEDLLGKPKFDLSWKLLTFPKGIINGKHVSIHTNNFLEILSITIE